MSKKSKKIAQITILSEEAQLKKRLEILENELDQQEMIIDAAEKKIEEAVSELDRIEERLYEIESKNKKS